MSPYVRKTAAHAIPKLYRWDPLWTLEYVNECQGLIQVFAQGGGGQNKIVWIIGGGQVCVSKHVANKGVQGTLPREILILDLLLDAIWWNLGLFLHKHNITIYCVIKAFILDPHVK